MRHQVILILDFGSQYTQLIARRLRELGVKTMIERGDLGRDRIAALAPIAVVLSGGPASVFEPGAIAPDPAVFALGVPVLGICYGMHLMGHMLGGAVSASPRREYGLAELEVTVAEPLFRGTPTRQRVWMSHGDNLTALPAGFQSIGRTDSTAYAAIADLERGILGLQFHPESMARGGSPEATLLFEAFVKSAADRVAG